MLYAESADILAPISYFKLLPIWSVYLFVFIFGVLIGSFLNVVIFRIPKKESIVLPASHCMHCGHKLAWYDNIPLFSWISLGGKCRYCKEKISVQYPIIEALNGVAYFLIFMISGCNIDSILYCAVFSALLALSILDARTLEIENGFHIYILVLAIIHLIVHRADWLSFVIGFFAASVPLAILYLCSKGRAIGGGDIKLMAVCGLLLGWQNVLLALMVGCVAGSVIHLIRIRFFHANRILAMGPYLSLGVTTAALFGAQIINWYITLLV